METQTIKNNRGLHPLIWVAAFAIILFSAAGIAALMGWMPSSMGYPAAGSERATRDLTRDPLPAMPVKPAAAKAPAQSRATPAPVAGATAAPVKCADCGVIESTREVDVAGVGSGLGAVGGAVVGGVLGSQVGNGRGRDVATVVGAVGGVVAGNEIEKRARASRRYEVTVRLDDGSSRVVQEANPPTWRAGDHVRVVDGAIRMK